MDIAEPTDVFIQAIHSIRDNWIERAAARFVSHGLGLIEAKEAATSFWKTANIDIEPEDAVDGKMDLS